MEQIKYEFVLEAAQPIAHHQEVFGNSAVFMRRKVRQRDGRFAKVPCITGDVMRHGLREAAAYAYLDAAGLLDGAALSEAALRLLFAGGQVTGSAGGAVKLGDYRDMVDVFPPLAILGGCAQNRQIPGNLWVDDATLICSEQAHTLPQWSLDVASQDGAALESSRSHLELQQRVRMDPTLTPGKRHLLSSGAREDVELRLLRSENASELDDAKEKDKHKSTMLPRTFERVVQGSLFYWSATATCYSALDVDTWTVMVATFLADARVGGKRGTGHGLLKPITGRNVTLARPAERAETIKPDGLSTERVGELFRKHVAERRDKAAEFLATVAA